ncbi:MAG TPA: NADH-quinone oxidoreductase subunit NuoG [Gammaproteobacteria bacterium]|nr:NADH-quinone oxidoreductase subunit NuoG [Gammaproteobacteria bacterium]
MTTIYIDNKPYQVDERQNLLHQCLSLGFDLPYFCWHPVLGSVGSCRQCAIKQYKDENDKQGRIVMACMTPASNGARISIKDPEAAGFRKSVIEWLMTSHPHDCPVCEEGGECHLQDMTLMTGHAYRRYRFKKRTFRNQDLGPFINHEMNRCITCYRCVRFYADYAGGHDLQALGIHNTVYFGRSQDGVLENEFSGNLAEVCPTGVFTDKTLGERYTRKWDLQAAPSVCAHCGVGCNISPNERYGTLRRIINRYNGEVNGYFICDRGRFGYGFVNSNKRVRAPLLRRKDDSTTGETVNKEQALKHLGDLLANKERLIGIGSPRASIEANYALYRLVGSERFYSGISEHDQKLVRLILEIYARGPARAASPYDCEQADAVLVLGEDVTNTAPRIALCLRQAIRHKAWDIARSVGIPPWLDNSVRDAAQDVHSPMFILTPDTTRLDEVATQVLRAAPADIARLGFAVAHELNGDAPAVDDLPNEANQLVQRIANTLRQAKRPLIVSGVGCRSETVIQAAANVAWALSTEVRPVDLCLTVPECNSLGVGLLGGASLDTAFKAIKNGAADTIIVLENDLYRRAERTKVDAILTAAAHVVVLDHLSNKTTARAELVLPAGTFAESDGTYVNFEGRAQRFFQVINPGDEVQESWRWLAGAAGWDWQSLDDAIAACIDESSVLRGIENAAPSARFRVAGQKIPRAPHRYSGRTAMHANVSVHEPKPPVDPDTPLSFSMEGYHGRAEPPATIPFFWAPAWNSNEALNKFQDEVAGPLHGRNPGVRLIEPQPRERAHFFDKTPGSFVPRSDVVPGELLIIPLYHIFGSEELSIETKALAQRAPALYVALNTEDAARLGVNDGELVNLEINGELHRMSVMLHKALALGLAGLPYGLRDLDYFELPAWGRISKGKSA